MILDELAAYSRIRVAENKKNISYNDIVKKAYSLEMGGFRFEEALKGEGLSFICEIKKASPSKGIIDEKFDYMTIAREFENSGAECISCLTEPKWFLGSDYIFKEIRDALTTPMLRKDFMIDEYQVYESKTMGADAILLICAILDMKTIEKYLKICDELGMSALVETHDEEEIDMAVNAGARLIGVNNRNLKNFTIDFKNAERLRDKIPKGAIYVAESGVKNADDVHIVKEIGADAVLIGEALMRAENKKEVLDSFRRA